jgi:protein-S-isoprenylcysteine O-methyltransferase Ste14
MDNKGKIWFAIQGLLALALIVVPLFSHSKFGMVVRIMGALLIATGIILLLISYRALGKNHSPGIKPIEESKLVESGPYALIRHRFMRHLL